MSNKKVLIKLVSLFLTVCILSLTLISCSQPKKAIRVISAGNGAWIYGDTSQTYEIKKIGEKTQNGVFYFSDYYVSKNGISYDITDERGKTVSTVKLAKKSETYNPKVYEFNLDEYTEHGILITGEMDYVKIFSSDPNTVYDLTVIVDYERTGPCDIEFKNVNIQTTDSVSVLYNYSEYDLNIKFSGNNYFKAGKSENIEQYYQTLNEHNIKDAFEVAKNALLFCGAYIEARAVFVYLDSIRDGINGNETFEENFFEATDYMIKGLEMSLDELNALLNNQNGVNGLDGVHAFMSLGSIYMYGDGNVTIIGGDGTDGSNATKGMFGAANSARGGDGGDAGCAIVSNILIENITGDFTYLVGNPGQGGMGAGNNPSRGSTGDIPSEVQCDFAHFEVN